MKSTLTKLSAIKRNPNNPRILKDEKLTKLVNSIKQFPQMLEIRPIVVNDDMVVLGGNMRLKACKEAGLTEVPVIKASDFTEEQQREFIIKDNVGFGEWDWSMLKDDWDVDELTDWGLECDASMEEGEDFEGLTDEDEVPTVEETYVSKAGDVWLLGSSRIMCGDSTDPDDVTKLMNGKKADMVFTDPPYNIAVEGIAGKIKNDDMSDEAFIEFMTESYKRYNENMKEGAVIYVAHSESERVTFTKTFKEVGFKYAQTLIWNKHSATLSRQDYNWKHEPIIFGWKKGKGHYFCEDFTKTTMIDDLQNVDKMSKEKLVKIIKEMSEGFKSTVIDYDRPTKSELHPTMKPVGLVQGLVENSSKRDWLVLDLFGGAGSTLIASINCHRRCNLMELDPRFADVIVKRWQDYTGQEATLEETGETFNSLGCEEGQETRATSEL